MFDWIVGLLESSGYLGVLFLTFLENVFPPIPSELILPMAGFLCAQGRMNVWGAILAGSVGSLAGATVWYYIGRFLGGARLKRLAARHGRWLTMEPDEVDRAEEWFQKHGDPAVFIGRFLPGIRTLISVPAGMARMRMPHFLLFSFLGTVIWTSALTFAGYVLEDHYDRIASYLNPTTDAAFALMVAWYVYRVITFKAKDTPSGGERPLAHRRWDEEASQGAGH